jgi:hypothetical protein
MTYQPRRLVLQNLGYVQVLRLNKLLQELDLLRDLHVRRRVLRGGTKRAVEQLGHDKFLDALDARTNKQSQMMRTECPREQHRRN